MHPILARLLFAASLTLPTIRSPQVHSCSAEAGSPDSKTLLRTLKMLGKLFSCTMLQPSPDCEDQTPKHSLFTCPVVTLGSGVSSSPTQGAVSRRLHNWASSSAALLVITGCRTQAGVQAWAPDRVTPPLRPQLSGRHSAAACSERTEAMCEGSWCQLLVPRPGPGQGWGGGEGPKVHICFFMESDLSSVFPELPSTCCKIVF